MRIYAIILCALGAGTAIAQPQLPYRQDFEAPREELLDEGWRLRENATLTEDAYAGDRALRVEVTQDSAKYAELFIPVEAGEFYRANVRMRCKDVERNPENSQHRGAVIFLQWADHEKGHVSGGSFPKGLLDTHAWTMREVSWTRQIPEEVGYVHVLLGIEGLGTAWFDELVVERIDPGWPGPPIEAPEKDATVETRLPELAWGDVSPAGLSYSVELSRDPDFADSTVGQTPADMRWRPDRWLDPGTWYWRLLPQQSPMIPLPPTEAHSFVVAQDAARWPVEIVPRWGWGEKTEPTLVASVVPPREGLAVSATIDGEEAQVTAEPDRIVITRAGPLDRDVHDVTISVGADGNELQRETFYCNRLPGSRVFFRDDRVMLIDGEPSFVLGAYRDPSDELDVFSGLEEAGFNLTHSYHFEQGEPKSVEEARAYLQDAWDHGIRVFLGMNRELVKAGDTTRVARFAGELMDEPGLLTWYMSDEPAARGLPVRTMQSLHDAVARVDPFHPVSIVICRGNAFDDYNETMDVVWADVYPLPSGPVTAVGDRIEIAREAAGPDKPVWAVLQAHDLRYWRGRYEEAVEEYGPVSVPTYEQTRCMAWLALAASADGLIWYWGPHGHYHMIEDAPTVWQGLVRTVHEFHELMPWLTAHHRDADRIAVEEPFRTWSRLADGRRLLAVINTADEVASVDLDLSQFEVEDIRRRGGDAVSLDGGHLRAQFEPLQVRLYVWPGER